MTKFTQDMIIGNIVRDYPELIDTFIENGMHCIGCPSAQMESINDACMVHGIKTSTLLDALNNAHSK